MNTFNENIQAKETNLLASSSKDTKSINRLEFIKKLALITGAIVSGCTPVRVFLKSYPDKYDDDIKFSGQILDAFVLTVIPGANPDDPDLSRIFNDDFYPFHQFCGFFTSDLCKKSMKLFGNDRFFELTANQKTQVIQAGLEDDFTTSQLYTAAIYIAQVSYFSCIYNDDKACALIDYQDSYGFMNAEMYHKVYDKMLADEITLSGNYL